MWLLCKAKRTLDGIKSKNGGKLDKFGCRLAEEITIAEKALHLAIEHRDALNYTQLTGYMPGDGFPSRSGSVAR